MPSKYRNVAKLKKELSATRSIADVPIYANIFKKYESLNSF